MMMMMMVLLEKDRQFCWRHAEGG